MFPWLTRTPVHTFILIPLGVLAAEWMLRGGDLILVPWGIPLLIWGFLQYKLVGRWRHPIAGGSPGMEVPPERLVEGGPYRYVRNPMYLGHLIFLAGLAVTLWSWIALGVLGARAMWFHRRVIGDEVRLRERFGATYVAYCDRVSRWVPGLL